MKLVISGSAGFVATESISQALKHPAITSIVALGRREILHHRGQGQPSSSQLSAMTLRDTLTDNRRDADKLPTLPFEETCKCSRDYAMTAIQALSGLLFVYMSGHFAPQSWEEVPSTLRDHGLINYGLPRE
ncbi:hypothetical protein ASPZODRAFT_145894 [Penicilliopsis zonata CBS 506.65]|uniref:Uncharacterized protein n=1 Tax=Penicilliopsis zonata CBS 506.65 TaxID=1073090 RepID=A0A1L9S8Q6_9EURO|nr:hypothetical protein ASPZODRAFT_145894 [Penicilliopsis zonata CBS 506.65]OJJ43539.1 hypothetical protein ASPZODRAFT_145894 [Penicilliopsis zonata CBS 506.65]